MLLHADPYTQALDWVYNYFKERRNMSYKRCGSILAKSDGPKGHDFVFVWMLEPTLGFVDDLINKIEEALEPLGAMCTISIKKLSSLLTLPLRYRGPLQVVPRIKHYLVPILHRENTALNRGRELFKKDEYVRIEVEELIKRFGSLTAVDRLSFEIGIG